MSFLEGGMLDKIVTILLVSLPTLVVAAIVYSRTKNVQVRMCLALAYLWMCIGFYISFRDIENEGYDPRGHLVTFPVFITKYFVKWIGEIPILGILYPFLYAALTYIISFSIISLPFYIYRLISKKIRPSTDSDGHAQERKDD